MRLFTGMLLVVLLAGCGGQKLYTASEKAIQAYESGEKAFELLNLDSAEVYFKKAFAIDSNFALAGCRLAQIASERGDTAFAVPGMKRALVLSAQSPHWERLMVRAASFEMVRDFKSAEGTYDSLGLVYRSSPEPRYLSALTHLTCRDLVQAEGRLNDALRADSTYAPAVILLPLVLGAQGRTLDAVKLGAKASSMFPEEALPHLVLGKILYWRGDHEMSINHYQAFLKMKPGDSEGLLGLGDAYLSQGMVKKALEAYSGAASDPNWGKERSAARASMARALILKGDAKSASQVLRAGSPSDSSTVAFCEADALLDSEMRNGSKARADVEKMLGLAARSHPCLSGRFCEGQYLLGRILLSEGKYDSAASAFKNATWQSNNPERTCQCYEGLAESYLRKGQPDWAVQAYVESLKLNPNRALSLYGLGKTYYSMKNVGPARGRLQQFLKIWAQADEGLPQSRDARALLSKLPVTGR
jgi:tetratricopeptide (TPR) repeat protein